MSPEVPDLDELLAGMRVVSIPMRVRFRGVDEREIALLRTVGATAEQVRQLVSREVVLLALVAVPVGAVPALWGAHLLTPLLVDAKVAADEPSWWLAEAFRGH